jgi:predicted DNA-binding protein (MmcQ/YjbR family)
MNIEELRSLCLSLSGVEETLPFGPDTLVYKVMGKVFCLVSLDTQPLQCNVKCDPDRVDGLREAFSGVLPGYHMNKKHWNTIVFDGSFTDLQARSWVLDSYALVVSGLPARLKGQLTSLQ